MQCRVPVEASAEKPMEMMTLQKFRKTKIYCKDDYLSPKGHVEYAYRKIDIGRYSKNSIEEIYTV